MVTRWTLACHKKKEAAKDESEKVQEIDANNEISEANKSDSDDDSAEDVSNWEVMENDEVNVSDSMDIVEFDMPQGNYFLKLKSRDSKMMLLLLLLSS
ncbi:hypothetical protein G6F47_012104 [Rhizopus delemar]|nr:hypothetical protein G6F48_013238 [Rhizopus delemar]KAG1582932.1 hypothetical protein G6F47_012104 [Rhizopus delemar]